VNLLGGRARVKYLYPFVRCELGSRFDLGRALSSGLLPSIYLSTNPPADLEAYAGTYLQQEVVAEGSARNIPAFSRFLRVAALCNGTVVNFTNVANDAQVPRTTVYEYFEVLKDTLIVHELPAWKRSKKRKPLVSSKFYFFDIGVAGVLQGRRFAPGTPEYGEAFETYVAHELRAYRDYNDGDELSFWRSASGYEVDFLIGDHTAVEVKAKQTVGPPDLKALVALSEEQKLKRYICVSLEPRRRTNGSIQILPYGEFLDALWEGEFQ
jgi:predicted AAA+ superfamily ATPase